MNNASHFLITVGIWAFSLYSLFPVHYYPGLTYNYGLMMILSVLWIYIGSYTPDLDKDNTKIIPISKGLDQKYRGYFIKPVQRDYNSFGHREITHSFNGVSKIFLRTLPLIILISLLGVFGQILSYYPESLIITIQYGLEGRKIITPLHFFDGVGYFLLILTFNSMAYIFGCLNHLWVDSITIGGIDWIFRKKNSKKMKPKKKTSRRWKGFIRTGTYNETIGVRYFLLLDLILFFALFLLLPTISLKTIRLILPLTALFLFICLGFLFRKEKYAQYMLVMDLCEECDQPMVLRMSGKYYGEKVYWYCKKCEKTFDAQQDLKIEELGSYFSRKMPFPLLILLNLILVPILFLTILTQELLFLLLAIIDVIFTLSISIRYEKLERKKQRKISI